MTGGQAVVRSLQQEGVDVVFGLPGVQIMHIYDAFYDTPGIRILSARHEQTAIYMADGYARITGRPGVGTVVPGPGVQNASAALGTAYSCSSPVLLVAGQVESPSIGSDKGALHEINDQLDIVRPVTKWCQRVLKVEDIPGALHEAMRQMTTGRPRPTHVEIPPDVLAASAQVDLLEPEVYPRQTPDKAQLQRAAALLRSAKKPLIWAGGGVILSDASAELVTLSEALGAPVATTPEGKGAMPEDHPLSLGVGYYGHGAPGWACPKADVILAVGTRLTQQMRGPLALRPPQRLVHIDADPAVIGKNYPAEIPLVADARLALEGLRRLLAGERTPPRWTTEELADIQARHQRWLAQVAPYQCEIIGQIQKTAGDDAIIASGITSIGYWTHMAYKLRRPRSYMTASYFATLGFAFPVALGAKVAAPNRPVVAIAGDGGFMYAIGDLATAVQHGINVVTIVFVDGAYGASLNDQRTRFGGREVGTKFHNPDFVQVAQAFGVLGIRAQPEALGPALARALEANRPAVIEVPIPTLTPPFQVEPRKA